MIYLNSIYLFDHFFQLKTSVLMSLFELFLFFVFLVDDFQKKTSCQSVYFDFFPSDIFYQSMELIQLFEMRFLSNVK